MTKKTTEAGRTAPIPTATTSTSQAPPRIGRNGRPAPADWPSDGPTPRIKNFTPKGTPTNPQRGGRKVALETLRRPQGATERELWEALATQCPGVWNTFDKIDDGYKVINDRDGWGIFTDERSGRTFAYDDHAQLQRRIDAVHKSNAR